MHVSLWFGLMCDWQLGWYANSMSPPDFHVGIYSYDEIL